MSLRSRDSKTVSLVSDLSKSHMLNHFCGIMCVSNGSMHCYLPHNPGLQHSSKSDIEERTSFVLAIPRPAYTYGQKLLQEARKVQLQVKGNSGNIKVPIGSHKYILRDITRKSLKTD